jgi:hypothetical protein
LPDISERFQRQIVKGGREPDDFAFPRRSTPGGPDPTVSIFRITIVIEMIREHENRDTASTGVGE